MKNAVKNAHTQREGADAPWQSEPTTRPRATNASIAALVPPPSLKSLYTPCPPARYSIVYSDRSRPRSSFDVPRAAIAASSAWKRRVLSVMKLSARLPGSRGTRPPAGDAIVTFMPASKKT